MHGVNGPNNMDILEGLLLKKDFPRLDWNTFAEKSEKTVHLEAHDKSTLIASGNTCRARVYPALALRTSSSGSSTGWMRSVAPGGIRRSGTMPRFVDARKGRNSAAAPS